MRICIPGEELLGYVVILYVTFWRIPRQSSKVFAHSSVYPPRFLHLLLNTRCLSFVSDPNECRFLLCLSDGEGYWASFHVLIGTCISSVEKMVHVLLPFFNRVVLFFLRTLYSWYSLPDIYFENILSHYLLFFLFSVLFCFLRGWGLNHAKLVLHP